MAVQIYQNPGSISFAGNPILVKVITDLADKTFLKVCIKLTAVLYVSGNLKQTSVFNLSIPTTGNGEEVWFDFSSPIQSMFTQVERTYFNGTDISSGKVRFSFKAWDEYLDENNEVISTETTASANSSTYTAIPGAYTDAQRMILPEDISVTLGSAKILTCKPANEMVPQNSNLILPIFSAEQKTVSIIASNGEETKSLGDIILAEEATTWGKTNMDTLPPGEYSISIPDADPVTITVIPKQPFQTYFEFINRLGGLESITCFGRRAGKSSIEAEKNNRYQGMNFRPIGQFFKRIVSDEQSISLSTGPINRLWAMWFIQEFFQAQQVWMMDESVSKMTPVIVEIDDDLDLYDESQAQLIDLKFNVVKSINGYITGNYMG